MGAWLSLFKPEDIHRVKNGGRAMITYLKGLWRLWKIRFDIRACQDIYFLRRTLEYFMHAEGKYMSGHGSSCFIASLPLGRPLIVSRLPQFSEILHDQIQNLRQMHDSRLATYRLVYEPQLKKADTPGSCSVSE